MLWRLNGLTLKYKIKTMDNNSQIEFRKLLSAYLEGVSRSGHDQHAVIAGLIVLESWIDGYANKEIAKFIGVNSKLKQS